MYTSEEFLATFQQTPTNQFFCGILINSVIESILVLHDGETRLREDLINPNDVIKHEVSPLIFLSFMVSWKIQKILNVYHFILCFSMDKN